jgi:hypothetical protein
VGWVVEVGWSRAQSTHSAHIAHGAGHRADGAFASRLPRRLVAGCRPASPSLVTASQHDYGLDTPVDAPTPSIMRRDRARGDAPPPGAHTPPHHTTPTAPRRAAARKEHTAHPAAEKRQGERKAPWAMGHMALPWLAR